MSRDIWIRYIIPLFEGVWGSLLFFSISVSAAAPVKTICGDYTYVVPDNVNREDAKRIATERARLEALAAEYGTLVSQANTTYTTNRDGESHVSFQSLRSSDVRGEWLGDTEEPTYRFDVNKPTGETSVYARVCGKAREITCSEVPLQVRVLRNGTQPKHESDMFRTDDDLYVSFLSPVNGQLAIFLLDEDKQVFCMLPYQSQPDGAYSIAANREYIFFSKAAAPQAECPMVDEYVMTCMGAQETNYLYFVFSTQPFTKPATYDGTIVYEDFNKWLIGLQRRDIHTQVLRNTITIQKQ